jgi:hypothetical protein
VLPFVLQRSGPSRDLTRTIGRAPSGAVARAGSPTSCSSEPPHRRPLLPLNMVRQRPTIRLNHGFDRWVHDLAKVGVRGFESLRPLQDSTDFTTVGRCTQGNIWGNSVSANVYSVGRYSGYISKFADSIALVIRKMRLQPFQPVAASCVSAYQIHRSLGISYKSSWFMMHRLREALRTGGLAPLGGAGKTVEADETIIGKNAFSPKGRRKPGVAFRNIVLTLVERGGSARSFHIDTHSLAEITNIVRANVHGETAINTDEGSWYNEMGEHFASHDTVHHKSDEYVRGDVTTNTVEGYYSIFKRGMKGVYQHCSEQHLRRYLAEYDFRYSNRAALGIDDYSRAEIAAKGIVGKRLTYRRPNRKVIPFPIA